VRLPPSPCPPLLLCRPPRSPPYADRSREHRPHRKRLRRLPWTRISAMTEPGARHPCPASDGGAALAPSTPDETRARSVMAERATSKVVAGVCGAVDVLVDSA